MIWVGKLPKVFAGVARSADAITIKIAFGFAAISAYAVSWRRIVDAWVISAARAEVVMVKIPPRTAS